MKTRTLDCEELDRFRLRTTIDPARAVWNGREGRLYLAIRKKAASFEVIDGRLRRLGDLEPFKDSILFLALSEEGRLFAITASKRGTALHEVEGRRNPLLSYPIPPSAVVATRRHVAAILPAHEETPATLHVFDIVRRQTIGALPLPDGETGLQAGGNDRVILRGGRRGEIRLVDLARVFLTPLPEPCRAPEAPRREPDPAGCGCPEPGRPGRPSQTCHPRPVPPDHRRPGGDGVDDDCWFTYTFGAQIVRVNICEPEPPDGAGSDGCARSLFERQGRLYRTRDHILAQSANGRTLTVIEPESLAVVQQMRLRNAASHILASRQSPTFLVVGGPSEPVLSIEPAPPALPLPGQFKAEVSERVVKGSGQIGAPLGPVAALATPHNLLIVPVVEQAQNFTGGTNAYHAALDPPLEKVIAYYADQTYKNFELIYDIFGRNTPGLYSGGPLVLTDNIRSFYNPPFVPGGLRGESTHGPLTVRVGFTGQEAEEVEVVSAVDVGTVDFGLLFPAAIYRIGLGNGRTLAIDQSGGASASLLFVDRNGNPDTLTLNASALSSDLEVEFTAADSDFGPAIEDLRAALQTMFDAVSEGSEFTDVQVHWVKAGTDLGSLYIVVRFAPGGSATPRALTGFDVQLDNLFGLAGGEVQEWVGSFSFSATTLESVADDLASYLDVALLLAEGDRTDGIVVERYFGSTGVVAENSSGNLHLTADINVSDVHGGGGVATINPGVHAGDDPLGIRAGVGQSVVGGTVTKDAANSLDDKQGLFEQLYGAMTAAIDDDIGPLGNAGWDAAWDQLAAYKGFILLPVALPPPTDPGAWSIDNEADVEGLRACSHSGLTISDPGGLADPISVRFLVEFLNFDSRLDGNTNTLAHETGHSLGLSDQYYSTKFNPQILYIDALDLMGGSVDNLPHFCAYHKLALEMFDSGDRELINPPAPDTTTTRRFIVPSQEWWDPADTDTFRAVFPNEPAGTDVTPAVVCDLGGDGGTLAVIEARSARAPFSTGISDRVIISNVLDYGTRGRYGQVIPDVDDVSDDVVKGLLRYRRHIHPVTRNLQPGDIFDLATAPAFPIPGMTVEIVAQGNASIGSNSVPVYLCEVVWELGPHADVGFSDNAVEYQSSDLGIDWIANGTENWPIGQPVGVGDTVMIPPNGTEAHEVMVRVWNFGTATANNVRVELFLRSPGGGGDPDAHDFYDDFVIETLLPESEDGPVEVRVPWDVPADQVEHFCWRAQVAGFELGSGPSAVVISQDAKISNNWAQQNIFETDIDYLSPPEPLETMFSIYNDGPFIERAYLEPIGLPRGATAIIRPANLVVPPSSRRHFSIRLEFDEALTLTACQRDIDVLFQCWRQEDHHAEEWGASLFKLHLRRKTQTTVAGQWLANTLTLQGNVTPAAATGKVWLRLDFMSGEAARWIETPLSVGGAFDEVVDTSGIENDDLVTVAALYQGSAIYAKSTSPPVLIGRQGPAG